MIKLERVYYKESYNFKETKIHFNYNNSDGIYIILEYKPNNEINHFITYNTKSHNNSRFKTTIYKELSHKDTDFIKAFNQYFNYQIKL